MEQICRDNNRPNGFYGEVYDSQTGGRLRENMVDRPLVAMWKTPEIDELLLKLNENLKQ